MKKIKMRQLTTFRKAFTLIELLVVCAIIVLLTLIVVINLEKAQAKSRDVQREADLTKIAAALEMYKMEYKVYLPSSPSTSFGDVTTSIIPAAYLPSIPVDPTNSGSYKYQYRGDATQFKVRAFAETSGADYNRAWCWNPDVVKKKLGDFFDPKDCRYLQVSSSSTALLNWN